MPMDPQLAALYGTAQVSEEDVEKLAAAKLAEELADEEQVDVAEMSDEDVEALAQAYLAAEEGGEEEAAVEEPEAEKTSAEKEAQEKLAEADYLGRVMAHAYVQELNKIAAAQAAEKTEEKVEKKEEPKAEKTAAAGKVKAFLKNPKKEKKVKMSSAEEPAAKEPSALDILAERRALEILKENGIDLAAQDEAEEKVEEPKTEKTSASEEQMARLAQAVEQRAFDLLQANGYIQEETEEKAEEKVEEPAEKKE